LFQVTSLSAKQSTLLIDRESQRQYELQQGAYGCNCTISTNTPVPTSTHKLLSVYTSHVYMNLCLGFRSYYAKVTLHRLREQPI